MNVVERAAILATRGVVSVSSLTTLGADPARATARPAEASPSRALVPMASVPDPAGSHPASDRLDDIDRRHILAVLNATHWVIGGPQGAAVRLGLKRSTLHFRMKRLGIERYPREV
jgi:transcriptional regulator with GAF, ATPase, and Fis domain